MSYLALGSRDGEAQALFCLTDALRGGTPADRQEARRVADSALAIVEELQLNYSRSWAYHYVALGRAEQGNLAEGAAFWKAATAAKESGNRELEPIVLANLGVTHARLGHRQQAMEFYRLSSLAHEAEAINCALRECRSTARSFESTLAVIPTGLFARLRTLWRSLSIRAIGTIKCSAGRRWGCTYRYVARYAEAEQELRGACDCR